jgi:hypothetical protein
VVGGAEGPYTTSAQAGLIPSTLVELNTTTDSFIRQWSAGLLAGTTGVLVGFTSDAPPTFVSASIQDGGTSAIGTAVGPVTVPEPSSAITAMLGAVGGLAYGWSRRRRG